MRAFSTVSRSIFGWVSAAVAVAVIAVSASVLAAPGKAYADTASHIEATGEIHVLVDGAGNASIPNVTLENTGSVAAYITGCTAPDELSGWTCDAVGKRIEPGQSVQASWSGQVSAETAAKLGSEAYFAGTLTYSYDDAELKGSVAIDNQDPCVGDTVTASASGLNVSDGQITYQWYRVKDGVETAIDGAVHPAYTVVDADAGCTLLCKLFSSDSICIGSVSSDATHEVKRAVEAFAVYSADDNSLNFYKRSSVPSAGEQFNGKTATAVYTGIETDSYNSSWNLPWKSYVSKIKTATVVDDGLRPFNMSCWFYGCKSMTACDLGKLDTSNVTDMGSMFYGCSALTTLDLSSWNTSNVTGITGMVSMFSYCSSLTSVGDLSSWDTSNATYLGGMFNGCSSLTTIGDLSSWDTSNVTNMDSMFSRCSKLTSVGDLSSWDTSKVTGMTSMFYNCPSLTTVGDLSGWDTSSATKMGSMFSGCSKLTSVGDLSGWDTSSASELGGMFYRCSALTTIGDLSSWDTSNAISMASMFNGCSALTTIGNLSSWDTSNVTGMAYMFYGCSSLTTLDLSSWDTSKVTGMTSMFYGCTKLQEVTFGANWKWVGTNGYLPAPDSTYITGADGKWYDTNGNGYAPADIPTGRAATYYASKDLVPQKTAFAVYSADDNSLDFYKRTEVPTAGSSFEGKTVTAVYTGIEDTNGSQPWSNYKWSIKTATVVDDGIQPKSTARWFAKCTYMTQCNMSTLDTSNTINTSYMFLGASPSTLDISGWNTSNLTDASYMFNGSSLKTIDLSSWDTSKVTTMNNMFNGCSSLTTVGNLSSWDTSNLTKASLIFANCSSLTTLDLSGWDTSKVTTMRGMFGYCSKLTTLGDLSSWDTSKVNDMSSMFLGCSKLSVNCSNWDVSKVIDHSNYRSDFNTDAPGVILPSAWQTSSDEDVEDSAIAPLCEDQENGDALSVSSGNNNEDANKTDGEASADSETEGNATTSADDMGAKEEEASDGIEQEEPIAA